MPVMTADPLAVTDEQRAQLEQMSRSQTLPHRKVVQARALLLAADGVPTNEVARRCDTTDTSVRAWRRRFEAEGIAGVGRIAKGRGRRSWLPAGTVAEVVRVTQNELPDDGSTHWTTRRLAERFGIGKDSVARIWRDHELKPWKVRPVQGLQRSPLRGEARRRGGAVSEPASAGGGVRFRREDPVPGAGSHPAQLADEAGPGRDHDP